MLTNGLAWFSSVRSYYEAGASSAFILHLNVHDPPGNALTLADFLRRAFNESHLVIEFDRARGLSFASLEDEKVFKAGCGFRVDPIASAMGKSVDDTPLPTQPDQAMALVGGFTERLTCLIVHNAGLVVPDAETAMLQPPDRTLVQVLLNLAKRDGHAVFLLTSNLAEVHSYIRSSSSGFLPITIPYPDEETRERFVKALPFDQSVKLPKGYTARAGRLSSGLTKRQILSLYQRFAPELPSDDEFAATKRKLMEDEFGGVLTPLNPDYGFEAVGGLFNVKSFFKSCVIEPIKAGQYSRVPMGVLMMGPAGTGKTCTAIAVAKEAGINAVTLDLSKIFGKYVGESEKNLEKALYAVVSLSPCLVFIDEIDQTVQRGGDGGDSGVSQRVFRRLLEFMSDTSHRGRVIFLAATNRPDLLDAALKRAGRMDQKLVFPIPDRTQRLDIFNVMLNKYAPARWKNKTSTRQLKQLQDSTEGFTGAEIETVVIKANELAMRDSAEYVTADHLLQALKLTRRTTQSVEYMTAIALVEVNDLEWLPEGYADRLEWAREYVAKEVKR